MTEQKKRVVLIIEDQPAEVIFMERLHKLPFFASDRYNVVHVSTLDEARAVLTVYEARLAAVIWDASLNPGQPFDTEPLIKMVNRCEVFMIGNTSNPEAQRLMESKYMFDYVVEEKTEGLKDLPWQEILPDL